MHPAGGHGYARWRAHPPSILLGDLGARWSYALLQQAFEYLRAGAAFITCSRDRVYRRGGHLVLDVGPFVAALEYASGGTALLAGKPSPVMYDAAVRPARLPAAQRSSVVMIGDDMHSDIAGAQQAGLVAWAVETGKFSAADAARAGITPDRIIPAWRRCSRNWAGDRAMGGLSSRPSPLLGAARGTGARIRRPAFPWCSTSTSSGRTSPTPTRPGFAAQAANALHVRTRERVVEREVLLQPGMPYDAALAAETARNLRALGIFRDVLVDTVRSDSGLTLRVVTKDGWSTFPIFTITTAAGQSAVGPRRGGGEPAGPRRQPG